MTPLFADYEGPQDFGSALFTLLSIAGLAAVGSLTFAYIAHCFFGIADSTSAGDDEVKWPEEPMIDRFCKAIWLGWALLLAGGPTYLVGSIIAGPKIGAWLIGPVGVGLLFPLFMLSMQIGGTLMHVVHHEAYRRLTKRPDHLIAYYAAVAVAYGIIGLGCLVMARYPWTVSPFGAVIVAVGILMAARLYGRLAHLVGWVKIRRREKFVESPGILIPPPKPTPDGKFTRGSEAAYGFKGPPRSEPENASAHQSTLKRVWVEEGADDPYGLADGPASKPPPQPELPESVRNPSAEEMALALRHRPIPPPKQPWTTGTFSFPFRPANWTQLAWLTLGITASGIFIRGIELGRPIG
jgi:hypothetical protein